MEQRKLHCFFILFITFAAVAPTLVAGELPPEYTNKLNEAKAKQIEAKAKLAEAKARAEMLKAHQTIDAAKASNAAKMNEIMSDAAKDTRRSLSVDVPSEYTKRLNEAKAKQIEAKARLAEAKARAEMLKAHQTIDAAKASNAAKMNEIKSDAAATKADAAATQAHVISGGSAPNPWLSSLRNDTITPETLPLNTTRRSLSGKNKNQGPCKTTNVIDKCWRCRPNWHLNRKQLASCIVGFGKGTTGGLDGKIYVVTSKEDEDVLNPVPGTLRHAVIQKEPLWIVFAKSMTITLKQELIMQGDKTIDGRGAKVHIAKGAGITIQFVKNIIIHNIYIHDIKVTSGGMIRDAVDHVGMRGVSDGDGINIFGSQNIWLDHLSMYRCADGIIDVIEGSTNVTISNCHWTDHDKVLLFGARDTNVQDDFMKVTVIYNHFGKRLHQRMPRVRSGLVHVVNNDYTHWNMYAIGGSHHATLISQGNRFIAPVQPEFKQVTHRDAPESEWRKWTWRSEGDLFKRGAFFVESGDPDGVKKLSGLDSVPVKPAKMVKSLIRYSGVIGGCKEGKAC